MLGEFGTQRDMMKTILIDLDKSCPHRCPIHYMTGTYVSRLRKDFDGVDYAIQMELLEMLWQRPNLQVEFVHPMGETLRISSHRKSKPVGLRLTA